MDYKLKRNFKRFHPKFVVWVGVFSLSLFLIYLHAGAEAGNSYPDMIDSEINERLPKNNNNKSLNLWQQLDKISNSLKNENTKLHSSDKTKSPIKESSVLTVQLLLEIAKKYRKNEEENSNRIEDEAGKMLSYMKKSIDPYEKRTGIFWRGYKSKYSSRIQPYSIYVPPSYDPSVPHKLIVSLHGGSSNHSIWIGILMGNLIKTKTYWMNHRTLYEPQYNIDGWIIVAPDGLGQIRWRWMAEQDVFDVIEDVKKNYNIDDNYIYLNGLSNGGIGAYTIGLKHAHLFAALTPMAGVTDWLRFLGAGPLQPFERVVLRNESAITYAPNAKNTFMYNFHGTKDPGMVVEHARQMSIAVEKLGIPHLYQEIVNLGHDVLNVLWSKQRVFRVLNNYKRHESPTEVWLTTASYRARRQFWLVLDQMQNFGNIANIKARVVDDKTINITTDNVEIFTLLFNEAPLNKMSRVQININGTVAYKDLIPTTKKITLALTNSGWDLWGGSLPAGKRKVPGLSGPIGDINYDEQVHVYGTKVQQDIPFLQKSADLGSRNWILARDYSEVRFPIIPDTQLTDEMMCEKSVVLYGNACNNEILSRIGDKLPIKIGCGSIQLRNRTITEPYSGIKMIYPNPQCPRRYLLVIAANNAEAVWLANRNLPIYLPDYLVFSKKTISTRMFMVLGNRSFIEGGFFDEYWQLPAQPVTNER